jgi:hypothetical protein
MNERKTLVTVEGRRISRLWPLGRLPWPRLRRSSDSDGRKIRVRGTVRASRILRRCVFRCVQSARLGPQACFGRIRAWVPDQGRVAEGR